MSTDRGLIKYVECIPTTKKSFLKHNEKRIEQASQLSCCLSLKQSLPRCTSEIIGYRYRRLEYYAEELGLIKRIRLRRWITYGKLVELTFYIKYESSKEKWNRHIEVRILLGIPLHQKCSDLTSKGIDYWIDAMTDYLYDIDPQLESYIVNIVEAGAVTDWIKSGCRELSSKIVKCDLPEWCNGTYKIDFSCNIKKSIKYVEIYDYRGYTYTAGENPCA